jgi:hemerythrin
MEYDKKVQWAPSMSVGSDEIDGQHKALIGQINNLIDAIASLNVNMGHLRQVMHFLYKYLMEHFAFEEKYMADNGYPGIDGHKKIHMDFVQFYKDFQAELKEKMTSDNFSSIEIDMLLQKAKKYLLDWLVNHIQGTDRQYANYIASR